MSLKITKTLLLGFCMLMCYTINAQEIPSSFEVKLSYVHSLPVGQMAVNMNQGSGLALEGLFTPENSRFSYGIDVGFSEYGLHKERINYQVDEQTEVETDMNVMNCFAYLNLVGRMNLAQKGSVQPYLQAKLGANYFWTALSIADPESSGNHDCPHVLERATLSRDLVVSTTMGIGVRADLTGLFNINRSGMLNLDLQANYTYGPSFRHMNVDNAYIPQAQTSAQKTLQRMPQIGSSSSRRDVIHEYYQANSYLSPLRMIDFRVGLSWVFQP